MLVLFVLIGTSVFASGRPEAAKNQKENGSVLRILTSFRIKSRDPVKQGFWYSEFGAAELLMKWDRDFKIKPWLLKSLEQVDELNWRLTLRPGVTFQNGKELNAEALDASVSAVILHLLAGVAARGTAIVIASHDMALLGALCHRIVTMRDGVL